ncbi:MAG TPA: DNA helicase RecQ, partial [Candidatus Wallbacteria bacterium]|nr:DNA helicase RecQ [Candidatus Wallbacteria bacterium]
MLTHPLKLLRQYFGYSQFREGQPELISAIISGRDALGIMPTGAGKSICFQIPALMAKGAVIVVSPLISLMKDQVESLRQAGLPAAFINSTLTSSEYRNIVSEALKGTFKLIYIAPERL